MDDIVISDEKYRINKAIEERQAVLDEGWSKPRKYYINGHEVSYEEYEQYLEKDRLESAMLDAEVSYYSRDTSTGEEWETDSDGDYTPDWLYDKI